MQKTVLPVLKRGEEDNTVWFEKQPAGTRIATISDFRDEKNRWLLNLPYLIHSELYAGRYYALRTSPGFFRRNDFELFLQKGRIYVFKKINEK
jgi:hypothetical protein